MLILRRILILLAGFILVALMTVLLLAPDSLSDFIINISLVVRLLLVIALYAIVVLAIYQQVSRAQRGQPGGLMVKSGDALTALSVDSARERIHNVLSKVPGVESVNIDVKAVQGKARIALDVVVDDDKVNLPEKQKEIARALKQVVQKQLGLKMAERPVVHLSFKEEHRKLEPDEIETSPEVAEIEEEESSESPQPAPERRGVLGGRWFGGQDAEEQEPEEAEPAIDTAESALESEGDEDGDGGFWSMMGELSTETTEAEEEEVAEDEEVGEGEVAAKIAPSPTEMEDEVPSESESSDEDEPEIEDDEDEEVIDESESEDELEQENGDEDKLES